METKELIEIAVKAGCETVEYEDHWAVRSLLDVKIVVTVPKVSEVLNALVEKIKDLLGL